MIRVEYFIILDKKEQYLNKEEHFKCMLQIIEGINIEDKLIKYNNIDIDYKIKFIESDDRIINCEFKIDKDSYIEEFEKFLRIFRTLFTKLVGPESIETLWDDIGFYYAKLAYPKIHRIENKMRSLITQFMYINVGRNWTSKHIPEEVRNSIKVKGIKLNKKSDIANFLDNVDFIQLTDFLFEKYSYKDKNQIADFIKKNQENKLEYKQLEEYIPISNWDRFFKSKLHIESKDLENKWGELYELRCKVAHNNKINKSDFSKIEILSDDIENKIDEAMKSLDNIEIEEEDKVNIIDKINKETKTNEQNNLFMTKSSNFYKSALKGINIDRIVSKGIKADTSALKGINIDRRVLKGINIDTIALNEMDLGASTLNGTKNEKDK